MRLKIVNIKKWSGAQYRLFIEKNFWQLLIKCSQGVTDISELKQIIATPAVTCGKSLYVIKIVDKDFIIRFVDSVSKFHMQVATL
jgi:hypothetical protein